MFTRQLLDALAIDRPVDLLGHSMGAAIGARLARFAPLVRAAPPVNFTANTAAAMLLTPPLIGEALISIYVEPMLRRRRRLRYPAIEDGRRVGMFVEQLRTPGFGRALPSMVRSGTPGDQRDRYRAPAPGQREVPVLRGDADVIMTGAQFDEWRELLPRAHFAILPGLPHAMVITDPDRVAPRVIRLLAAGGAPPAGELGDAAGTTTRGCASKR